MIIKCKACSKEFKSPDKEYKLCIDCYDRHSDRVFGVGL